ncbi:MAG TPA: hypothetical protein VMR31_07495 [Myxococcota bacterium]|nr:hypothetical protein [Myxococcota bacterium]
MTRHSFLGLVLLSALSFAVRAEAGFVYVNPQDPNSCGPIDATTMLQDPNFFASRGPAEPIKACVAACKVAGAQCVRVSKRNWACLDDITARQGDYEVASCLLQLSGAEAKACKAEFVGETITNRKSLHDDLVTAVGNCSDWTMSCVQDCQNLGVPAP